MPTELVRLLRAARSEAGISQLELSLRLGISQRHVGFVEIGRARPSRPLLIRWLAEIGADAARASAGLLLAGYAPVPDDRRTGSGHPDPLVMQAIRRHSPYPGLVFDADWHIVRMNAGARFLCGLVMPDLRRGDGPLDMLAILADPMGWLARARDPIGIAAALLAQLRAEQWLRPALAPRIDALEATLCRRYGPLSGASAREPGLTSFDVTIDTADGPVSFSAMQAVFGLPHDATRQQLRAELWYPTDADTAELMRRHAHA